MSDTSTESRQPDIQVAGDNSRAVTGDGGVSYAGRMGVAISGVGGVSQVGDMGFAVAGDDGIAISGIGGFSIAGVGGMARSGPGGIITISGVSETGHRYSVSADIDDVNGPSANTMYRLDGHRFVLASGSRAKVV